MKPHSYTPKKYRQARALRYRIMWYGVALCAIGITGGILYGLFWSEYATKFSYAIEGTDVITSADFHELAPHVFSLRLPGNILFLNEERAEEYLQKSHAQLASVAVNKDLVRRMVSVRATEHARNTVWCDKENCYWIDDEGIAFDYATPSVGQLLVAIQDPEGPIVDIGIRVVSRNDLATIKEFADILKMNGFVREAITRMRPELREAVFTLYGGTDVRVSLKNPSRTVFEEFIRLAKTKNLSQIEYFDLTTENRIYFKKR